MNKKRDCTLAHTHTHTTDRQTGKHTEMEIERARERETGRGGGRKGGRGNARKVQNDYEKEEVELHCLMVFGFVVMWIGSALKNSLFFLVLLLLPHPPLLCA